jgi:cell wall-associated NlpC family hydrolase
VSVGAVASQAAGAPAAAAPALDPAAAGAPAAPASPADVAGAASAANAADAIQPLPAGLTETPAGPKALEALAVARQYIGTPYLWGGSKPSTGFDCSGLMQWAYHQAGISIGRVTTQQIHDGVAVDRQHLQAGDMVFFQDSSGYVHHVGMYIGDDKFIHAPHTGDVVKISSLDEPYYAHQFAGGRRMDTSAPVDPATFQPAVAGAAPVAAAAPVDPTAAAAAPAGAPADPAAVAAAPADPAAVAAAPVDPAAAAAAAPPPPASGATGGFAALTADPKGGAPRSTVQVLKAVEPPAAQPAAAAAAPAAADTPAAPAAAPAAAAADAPAAHAAPPLDPAALASASASGYPGDNAQPDQYAAWMAAAAQKAGLPPQLPIMAALTESGLHNLSGGDRDSMGFFQMRTSVWNQGEYAGYGQNPDLQLKWFITQALAIKEQRLARGETTFQTDPGQWGNWIADVERPQEDLRGRYQTHLDAANQLLGTG